MSISGLKDKGFGLIDTWRQGSGAAIILVALLLFLSTLSTVPPPTPIAPEIVVVSLESLSSGEKMVKTPHPDDSDMPMILPQRTQISAVRHTTANAAQVSPVRSIDPQESEMAEPSPFAEGSTADAPPQLIEKIRPKYPPIARAAEVEGELMLAIVITETGAVENAEVIRNSAPGYGFDTSALNAAYRMKFKPITQKGVPVRARIYYPIRFILNGYP